MSSLFGVGSGGFPSGSAEENLPAIQEMQVQSLHQEDPLKEGMATHSTILAWRIPWTEELVAYSPRVAKESDTTERLDNKVYLGPVYFGDNTKKNYQERQ